MKAEFNINTDELAEKIANSVAKKMRGIVSKQGDDVIFDIEELCEKLKVTKRWLYEQTHLKSIPFIKIPGSKVLRFSKRDINKWIETNKVPAINQISNHKSKKLKIIK